MTVLNGNGVTGSASNASYLLGQRGYQILTPPNGMPANAPNCDVLPDDGSTSITTQTGAKAAARKVANAVRLRRRRAGDTRDHARSRTARC